MRKMIESAEAAHRRQERERQARLRLEDLSAVAGSASGERFLLRLLADAGFGQPVAAGREQLFNQGQELAREIAQAAPGVFLNICRALYGLGR